MDYRSLGRGFILLRVYEVLIKLIILTIALIHLVTFHLMIYDNRSYH